jgi:putative membrane protein
MSWLLFADTVNATATAAPHPLATLNAALNGLAGSLLILGYILIKARYETAHRRVMVGAFGVSVVFLISYLTYHSLYGSKSFQGTGTIRTVYMTMLISHVILAAAVPVLALRTIWLGYQNRRVEHNRIAKITLPIWLYVSVTGVLIYLFLYILYPAPVV